MVKNRDRLKELLTVELRLKREEKIATRISSKSARNDPSNRHCESDDCRMKQSKRVDN